MKPLQAELLAADPRVAEAKRLLREALAEHQRGIDDIRPADGERQLSYGQVLSQFAENRAGTLFYPYLGSGLGNGPLVELADGSVKYDMISGIGVHHWGHNPPAFLDAAVDATLRDTIMQGNLQQNVESAALADSLVTLAGPSSKLRHCFLSTSGAMANENALKLVFHKRPGASRVLAFERTFAGRTLALAQITDKPAFRAGLPTVLAVDYIPFFDAAEPLVSTTRTLEAVRRHLARYPGAHAAMWCELVLGEGGFYPGDATFFTALMGELRSHGIAIVVDEVQTFGRTTRPFAFQHFGLEELVDVATIGKMLQVCATLFTDGFRPAPGLLSQTFTASTSAILAARYILQELARGGLFGRDGGNTRVHKAFVDHLEAIAARHPDWIRGPYGVGGMVAFTPFDGSESHVKELLGALFEAGVIAFYTGAQPARVRFLPPAAILADHDITRVCEILETTLERVARAEGGSHACDTPSPQR